MTGTGISTDQETQYAVDALVYRLRNRGGADDEPFAAEFIAALKLRGWRPTAARPSPPWHRPASPPVPPDADTEGATSYRLVRAEIEARREAGTANPENGE